MNSSLPNGYKYDSSNSKEMDEFLKHIYTIAKSNPNMFINSDIIYSELKHRNLKKYEKTEYGSGINCREYFSKWENRFKNRKTDAFCDEIGWPYWFQFINGDIYSRNFIKLYVPLDYDHLLDGVTMLFNYMDKENITHQSKVASYTRIDNVIIRLKSDDYESLNKIVNFIKNNEYIESGLNKCNPFIPTINGVGFMQEHGNSYNSDISDIISLYIMEARRNNKNDVNIEEFREFLRMHSSDKDLINTFEASLSGRDRTVALNGNLSKEQKVSLLLDSLNATYKKYGIDQIEGALLNIIKYNKYTNITNGGSKRYRDRLIKNVSPDEIKSYLLEALSIKFPGFKFNNLTLLIKNYCALITNNVAMFELEEISNVTLNNYDEEQLYSALYKYVFNGETSHFSRFANGDQSVNYRDKLKYIKKDNALQLMQNSLLLRGIDVSGLKPHEVIGKYVRALNNSLNKEDEKRR